MARRNNTAATGQGARDARPLHQIRATGRRAERSRGLGRPAPIVAALVVVLAIAGGVVWLAVQQSQQAAGVSKTSVAIGHEAPERDLALSSTQGGTLSLRQFEGHKVVLYFYEEST